MFVDVSTEGVKRKYEIMYSDRPVVPSSEYSSSESYKAIKIAREKRDD